MDGIGQGSDKKPASTSIVTAKVLKNNEITLTFVIKGYKSERYLRIFKSYSMTTRASSSMTL